MSDYMKDMFIEVREKPKKTETTTSFSSDLLIKLIEQVLDAPLPIIKEEKKRELKYSVSLIPEIEVSELGWSDLRTPGQQGIDHGKTEREVLKDYLDNILDPGGMSNLKAKVQALSDMGTNPAKYIDGIQDAQLGAGARLRKVISFLVFYKTLTKIIANFNASSAGFSFESFLATLLGGEQIPASGATTIADFTDVDGVAVSLKLYAEGTVEVGGSFDALVGDVIKDGSMTYLVVTKDLRGSRENMSGTLRFYRFEFNLDNILDIVARTKAYSARSAILPFVERQEGEEDALQDIRDEEGNIVTDIEKVRFNPKEVQAAYKEVLARNLADNAGTGGWAGKYRYAREIPFPALNVDEIVANPYFDYTKPEQSYIAGQGTGRPFAARNPKLAEMIAQLRTVPSVEEAEQRLRELVPEQYYDRIVGIFLKRTANIIRISLNEVLKEYLERRAARKAKVGALDIPKYELPKKDEKTEVKAAKSKLIQDAALRSAAWYSRQSVDVKRAALLKTNGYLNDYQFSLSKREVLDLATKNTIGEVAPLEGGEDTAEVEGVERAEPTGYSVPTAAGDFLGELTIGMESLQVMLNDCIDALNTDIFTIFEDLEQLSVSLNTFFAKGLQDTDAAGTAMQKADSIEGKTAEVAPEAKSNK
jgi:predicted transcriptional regulator